MKDNFSVYFAIKTLQPHAEFGVRNNDYDTLEWYDDPTVVPIPTKEEVIAEINRQKEIAEKTKYAELRKTEYPPIADYLDGVVKGDQNQIEAYIAACQAVKAKYPKPE